MHDSRNNPDIKVIGIRVTDNEFKKINFVKDEFHGEWNYKIIPN